MERIVTRFAESSSKRPNKIALITEKNQLTYADLHYVVQTLETQLRTRGLKRGSTLVLHAEQAEFIIAGSLLGSKLSLKLIYSAVGPVIEAGIPFDFALMTEVPEAHADDPRLVQVTTDWFAGLGSGPIPDLAQTEGDGAVIISSTSGSTGRPKFITGTEADRLRWSGASIPWYQPDESTRFLSTMSTRQNWTANTILKTLFAGGSAIALKDHRNRFLPYLDLYRLTHLLTTPMTMRQVLEVSRPEQYLGTLEVISVSGALTTPELVERIAEVSTAEIRFGYGTAEIGGVATGTFDRSGQRPEGYIGTLYRDDLETAFFDQDLELLPGATEGIIGFRSTGEGANRSYVGSSASEGMSGFVNGYFIPGDIVRREGKDLYFIGRRKNILNISGNKFSLDAVQEALEQGTAILHAGCVGVTDPYGIELLRVYYEAPNEVSTEAMDRALADRVGNLRVGRAVRLEAMPMTESGKIDMSKIRAMAQREAK